MRETVMLSEGGRCRMTETPDLCLSVCNGVMMQPRSSVGLFICVCICIQMCTQRKKQSNSTEKLDEK